MFERHDESTASIEATPGTLFAHLDRHERLSGHMSGSSWMMAGGRMEVSLDEQEGRAVGSRIGLAGRVLGLLLFARMAVTEREVPRRKVWETVGEVRLLVIGPYRMGFDIAADGRRSRLRVFIDYDLPERGFWRLVGRALGPWYAGWCTRRMVGDAARAFQRPGGATSTGLERDPAGHRV